MCLFSSDSYGIGHVVQNCKIANHVVGRTPDATALLVTGVGVQTLPPLVAGCDYIRVPAILREPGGGHHAVSLRIGFEELRNLRSHLLAELVSRLSPRVFIADHISRNIRAETELALERMVRSNERPWRILGMHDLLHHPDAVDRDYVKTGLLSFAAKYYDEVWVYGHREVYDWSRQYQLPDSFMQRVRYIGYLVTATTEDDVARAKSWIAELFEVDRKRPMVLVSGGGGHDAYERCARYLDAVPGLVRTLDVWSLVVAGPLMSPNELQRLKQRAEQQGSAHVRVIEYTPRFNEAIQAADAVVTMGGYTLPEIAAAGVPCVVMPREQWVSSQQTRARLMADLGCAMIVPSSSATPETIESSVAACLKSGRKPPPFRTDGLEAARRRLIEITASK
jgi:predicted glycosyltransferase